MNLVPDPLQGFFLGVCSMSLRAAVLVSVTLVVYRLAGPWLTARWRHMLWGLLLIPMLIPWGISVPFFPPVINELSFSSSAWRGNPVESAPDVDAQKSQESPKDLVSGTATASASDVAGFHVGLGILATLWLLGAVALLIHLTGTSAMLKRRVLRESTIAPHWIQELFEEARRELTPGCWPVLIVTRHVSSPALLGALRPKILLPESLVEQASPEALRHLFLHELAHLKRGDIWANWLWSMTLSLHWFNPLLWLAGRCIARERELACDESVLDTLPTHGQRIDYGQALLAITRCAGPIRRSVGWVGIQENQPILKRRIDMIANYRRVTMRHKIAGLLLMLGLGTVALLTSAEAKDEALSVNDAELMGRVEHFFLNNFRDITARKSMDWGHVESDKDGNRTIRYQYTATIWDKKKKVMNQLFTFDKEGIFVKVDHVDGYPKDVEEKQWDTTTDKGMKELVERFFSRNYRDVTARKSLEWGKADTNEGGNRSIRYKYEATIWGKDVIIQNKVFTFTPAGEYVSVKDAEDSGN